MVVAGLGQCSLDCIAVVDSYPRPDTKKEVLEWHEQGGGPVATALVALSRLGLSCRFAGVTGDDDAAEDIRGSLAAEGVDIRHLARRSRSLSQVAFIVVEKATASRTIFWRRPSGAVLSPSELDRAFLDGCSFLMLDGLMIDVSLHAAEEARKKGIPVMLDGGRLRPGMLDLARISDYVVISEEFSRDLGWSLSEDVVVREQSRLGIRALTVTLGKRGSITAEEGRVFHIPAFPVSARDTTGAGDVFHGAYVYGLLRGWDLRETVLFATAVAGMKCEMIGGRQGIPSCENAIAFLSRHGHTVPSPETDSKTR